jgi:hypothetical protein
MESLLSAVERLSLTNYPLVWFDMNTTLVKSAPLGDFAEISVLMNGWQAKFQMLVSQKRPIKYDFYPLPSMPQEIRQNLDQQGYIDLVLESDQWQHFLVPNSLVGGR